MGLLLVNPNSKQSPVTEETFVSAGGESFIRVSLSLSLPLSPDLYAVVVIHPVFSTTVLWLH